VIFYSDIFDAGGKALDQMYLKRQPSHDAWSTFVFPQESPSARDLKLWEHAIIDATPQRQPEHRLGGFVAKGHKIWE
jgi:hypothetical protein